MLTELRIENLGVIADLSLTFDSRLCALTGETGAGKTMVVEAIDLLVGGRADAGLIRPGAAEARVEGRFVSGDDEWVLARVIPVDGRSRSYINGRLATAGNLSETGELLVDLHGQHSHQRLLGMAVQRAALDRYGHVDLSTYQAAVRRSAELQRELESLGGDERSGRREIELIEFQLNELLEAQT